MAVSGRATIGFDPSLSCLAVPRPKNSSLSTSPKEIQREKRWTAQGRSRYDPFQKRPSMLQACLPFSVPQDSGMLRLPIGAHPPNKSVNYASE